MPPRLLHRRRRRHACLSQEAARNLGLGLVVWLVAMACLWMVPGAMAEETLGQVDALATAASQPLKGGVTENNRLPQLPTINPSDLKEIDKGNPLEMTVATTLSGGLSQSGDEFFGKIMRDYTVDGQVVIPKGTLVHGVVDNLTGAKWAGRNGHITTRFDYLITPDGREIPITGGYTNKDTPLKAAAKVAARSTGYSLAGGVVGAVMVLKYGGIAAIAASNGYALAGGAAVGGALGLGASLVTKGKSVMIPPGAELKIKLQDKLVLPSMNLPAANASDVGLDGLSVKVTGTRIAKDPFGEPTELTLSLEMQNNTPHTFSFFDIALEDEQGTVFYASPFGDTSLWFQKLLPNSRMSGNVSFSVDNPKLRHTLVFFKQYTREPITRIALTDAMRQDDKKHRGGALRGRSVAPQMGIMPPASPDDNRKRAASSTLLPN